MHSFGQFSSFVELFSIYIPTYLSTYVHTLYIHTYVHTYIHYTYIINT